MAQTIYCSSDDGNPAALLITNLDSGETVGVCPACLPTWCLAIVIETAPELLQEAARAAQAAAQPAQEAEAAADPPRPKRRRTGRETASEALTSEASPFTEITPDSS